MTVKANSWIVTIWDQSYTLSPYVLFNGIGFIVGLFLLDTILDRKLPYYKDKLYIAFVLSVLAGWVGAHLIDWLVSDSNFFRSGFTFYGGLIGGLIFYIPISYKYSNTKIIWSSLNAAIIPFLIAHSIGRVGCFFAGCCHGKQVTKENFLHLIFNVHPTQIYESLFLLFLALFLSKVEKKYPLFLVYIYFITYGVFRFLIEFLRGDPRLFIWGLSISQWISITFVCLITSIIFVKSLLEISPKET